MNDSVERKKVAIVGSGISGLTAAYLLSRRHQVTLYEANDCLGGHTATIDVELKGKRFAVDTGFIVFNDRTYPNFNALLDKIGVQRQKTEMSFSVHNTSNGLEYNGHSVNTLFAQRRNLLNPRFIKFVTEILRFNKLAKAAIDQPITEQLATLDDFIHYHGFDDYFSVNYILPMVAAIWSSSIDNSRDFPLRFFLQFFNNHGLLDITNRPQWYVIKGGSKSYIPALIKPVQDVRLAEPIESVRRTADGVEVTSNKLGTLKTDSYDDVIFACHSDQAMSLLADATAREKNILGKMRYRDNEVVLHTDPSLLPVAKRAHASWNYWIDKETDGLASLTYSMNILQGLKTDVPVCVTLNRTHAIAAEHILRTFCYAHPVFTADFIEAQAKREEICGKHNTHFCGAYWYNGFHEDGVKSALDVCARFGEAL